MRMIGQVEEAARAELFAAYLYVHRIDARLEGPGEEGEGRGGKDGGMWRIWVLDEDRVEEAKGLFSRFCSMPDAEEFQKASAAAAAERRQREHEEEEGPSGGEGGSFGFFGLGKSRRNTAADGAADRVWPWGGATMGLLGLVVVAVLVTRLGQSEEGVQALVFSLDGIRQGQVWRLFTPVLLHADLWGLIFNLLWMQDLGRALESQIGSRRYVIFLLGLAMATTLTSGLLVGVGGVGLMGMVYGVFGYLWMRPRVDPAFGTWISPLTGGLLMIFMALGVFGMLGPGMAMEMVAGLALGVLWGWVSGRRAA